MAKAPLTITVDPDGELARALDDADEQPVVLDRNGVRYTVAPEDLFARYDPRQALAALRRARGALTGVDTQKLLADLAEQREQDSVGRPAR